MCYSSSRFVPLIFFIAFFRNILESHSLNGRTLLKVAGRLTLCLFVSRFVPLLFFISFFLAFLQCLETSTHPSYQPLHSASRMRKELSPLHYPCYPILYKKTFLLKQFSLNREYAPKKTRRRNIQAEIFRPQLDKPHWKSKPRKGRAIGRPMWKLSL